MWKINMKITFICTIETFVNCSKILIYYIFLNIKKLHLTEGAVSHEYNVMRRFDLM